MALKLSEIPTFVWSNVAGHSKSYGMGLISVIAASAIQKKWGKVAAACFVAGTAANYPFIIGRIPTLSFIDLSSVMQALLAGSLPFLSFYSKKAASVYVPMVCTALAISLLKKAWDDAEKEKKITEQIKELDQQNSEYARLFKEMDEASNKLDKAVRISLGIPEKVQDVAEGQDALVGALDCIDQKAKSRLNKLREEIEGLALLCDKAKSSQTAVGVPQSIVKAHNELEELISACAKRKEELQQLNSALREAQAQLRAAIEELSEREEKDMVKLMDLEKYSKQIGTKEK